ncbi:hypothetical protein C9E82_19280 [Paracoccus siganidrum]|uniref:Uncharacterized protein n=1 Tax=Paracoccus siganidrum TaxID=1276757 RepID=A0A418ZZW5_9RHOB|nr:hypothetical protein D3P05_18580 [Paracoccus siganidrum]RMC29927.1 hypothetical protein C9E82_19280 [Paracoccus siganidrum]
MPQRKTPAARRNCRSRRRRPRPRPRPSRSAARPTGSTGWRCSRPPSRRAPCRWPNCPNCCPTRRCWPFWKVRARPWASWPCRPRPSPR